VRVTRPEGTAEITPASRNGSASSQSLRAARVGLTLSSSVWEHSGNKEGSIRADWSQEPPNWSWLGTPGEAYVGEVRRFPKPCFARPNCAARWTGLAGNYESVALSTNHTATPDFEQ
jgi:hypothetical protein